MSDVITHLVDRLIESVPVLLLIAGVLLFLLGLAGGVQYNRVFPIDDVAWRVVGSIAGVVIFGIGLSLWTTRSAGAPRPESFGIKIAHPKHGDVVDKVDVRGGIKKKLPPGYSLMVVRIYPSTDGFVPLGKATFAQDGTSWEVRGCDIGGKMGEQRQLAACLVGPAAAALFDYFAEAGRIHNITMNELYKATNNAGQYLPPIKQKTPDLIECDRVALVRK